MYIRSARSDNELIVGEDVDVSEHRNLEDPNKAGIFDRWNRDIFGLVRWKKFTIAERQVPETALGRKLLSITQSTERDLKRKWRPRLLLRNRPNYLFLFFAPIWGPAFLKKRNRAFIFASRFQLHSRKRRLFF